MRRQAAAVQLAATEPAHVAGRRVAERPNRSASAKIAARSEATPSGNAVDLEEQMAKINEIDASTTGSRTQLYRKYLGHDPDGRRRPRVSGGRA